MMSGLEMGIVGFFILLTLLLIRIHISIAMFLAAAGLYAYLGQGDLNALMYTLNGLAYARLSNYDLAVVPLFIFMGQLASRGGMSKALFQAASSFIGHWRGGLAMASVGSCAAFGAICGSSLATAATMGQVAIPELKKRRYSGELSTATLAAGGTLGILIPPSVPLIIYAVLTQESIGKLFVAAIIPGILALLGYVFVIKVLVSLHPEAGPTSEKVPFLQALKSQVKVLPIFIVFAVVIISIYGGWANPTEAASIGAASCGIISWLSGGLTWKGLVDSILQTAMASAMIFMVLIGADLLNSALALTQMPAQLANWVVEQQYAPLLVLFCILMIYLVLGCVMDSLAMILLTIPIFYPIILGLDFWGLSAQDKTIWFGIVALMVVEIGLITPPVGMNLFIINKMDKDTPLLATSKWVLPFIASDLIRIAVIACVPGIALWLVHLF
ncbi:TRAP transporter large permease [Pasteurella multocida subsp. multocida]|uniref:TRAP transporter large permease protein n=1 Tax=Pasteurella multocida TaxID=747 RepID=A0A9X3ZKY9_PASMD|nr:TRAP transporter large permease [Pasteurella multocida]MBF6980890.1 TRAP transporter large permease [Pasteurella multocida]MDA5610973.1 TRAP transporter large permease [Pasteurella multocida]MDA5613443.1 TRAP transporter large permease [Pasteurella multocida]MDA5618479.1 TRAP transporter large permease [Pasteurella multocida subsp. multocida]MDA5620970.1 TRAP transporter large permease [Pasteurella multocida subsp. multocida]